jgi:hypothetical protein
VLQERDRRRCLAAGSGAHEENSGWILGHEFVVLMSKLSANVGCCNTKIECLLATK